jgi:hypothetical protein
VASGLGHCAPCPLEGYYGLWRRSAERSELDTHERRKRDAEEAWDLRHEEHADRLDALIGCSVELLTEHEAMDGETYDAGERFIVKGRVRDMLLCETLEREEPAPMQLKEDWVRLCL